jgi:16S rRNA U516 pseudouridylate synthase RsuA-like enzyme
MYANGGVHTTKGSLFDQAKLDITYVRQDDCNKQMADLVKFAGEYKKNPNAVGVLITFMGDGMPAFMTSLSKELEPLGPGKSRVRVVEGKYHQVRRMLASRGMAVTYLRRDREGGLTLDGLAPGEVRELTAAEVAALDRETGMQTAGE